MGKIAAGMNVYLAGPDVFLPNAGEEGRRKCSFLQSHGFRGLFPLDHVVPEGTRQERACGIFAGNVRMLESSRAVLAEITPFRGPSLDPGTAWEIGYAHARGIPVVCYGTPSSSYLDRCRELGLEGEEGKDCQGLFLEDFGYQDNLMIICCATALTGSFEEAVSLLLTL